MYHLRIDVSTYADIASLSRSVCNFNVLFVLLKESAGGDIQSPLTPESINGTDDERVTPEVTQNSEPRAEPTQNALPFTHRYRFHSHILIKWYLFPSLLKGPSPTLCENETKQTQLPPPPEKLEWLLDLQYDLCFKKIKTKKPKQPKNKHKPVWENLLQSDLGECDLII